MTECTICGAPIGAHITLIPGPPPLIECPQRAREDRPTVEFYGERIRPPKKRPRRWRR